MWAGEGWFYKSGEITANRYTRSSRQTDAEDVKEKEKCNSEVHEKPIGKDTDTQVKGLVLESSKDNLFNIVEGTFR